MVTLNTLMTAELPDEYGIWNYVALILRPDHPQFVSIAQQFSDYPQLTRYPASLNRITHLKFFQYLLPVTVYGMDADRQSRSLRMD